MGILRRYIYILAGRDVYYPLQYKCPCEKHGSDYGGWYICPQGIDRESIIYSIGVGEDVSFDLSLIEKYGLTVHAFDPTPMSIRWVKAQQLPQKFHFYDFGIADFDGTTKFYPPENPDYVSHTITPNPRSSGEPIVVKMHRLSTIMQMLGHTRIDILKMDIEGAEYEVIDDIIRNEIDIRQILVEFHHRFSYVDVGWTRDAVEKLNGSGYRIFYISSLGEEYCFIRPETEKQ
ncbi:MAG: FkbM family methyltransferase [Calditrichia bacterium]